MFLFRLPLKTKLLLSFIILSAVPLFLVNILWFNSSKDQLIKTTSDQLSTTASDIAHQIDSYLAAKEIGLIIHSQTESILGSNIERSTSELQNLLLQDKDIYEISLLNSTGKEIIRLNRTRVFNPLELVDQSSSLAFKIPTFVGGDRYISPMYINEEGKQSIYIAIPVVKPDKAQVLQELTTSSSGKSRKPGEILGVLTARINLSDFWNRITSSKIGDNGYIFIVDDKGNVLAHKNNDLAKRFTNLRNTPAVNNYVVSLTDPGSVKQSIYQGANEFGVPSLTAFNKSDLTNWGVMAEIPLSDVLKNTNQIIIFVLIIIASLLSFIFLSSLWMARAIVKPISDLTAGSDYIGRGNLNYQISVKTGDEIERLADSFNNMSRNLKFAFDSLEQDKNIINAERAKVSLALANIDDGVILVDNEKDIIVFNKSAERLTGYIAGEVIGRKIYEVLSLTEGQKTVLPTAYCPEQIGGSGRQSFSKKDLTLHKRNSEKITVDISSSHIELASGAKFGWIISLHDKSKEEQLEKMKLDFVSMAVHELRTPITAIRGYLSVYLHENEKLMNGDQKLLTHNIYLASERLAALVENLLSVSRIENATFSINLKPANWTETIREVVNELTVRAKEKNISLAFVEPASPLPLLVFDKLRMSEVLSNIVLNAINYTPSNGAISVWTNVNNGYVETHVRDTGPGIAAEQIPNLFTKFFRISGGSREKTKGTGLGLYLSKAIVEKHSGRIWVTSIVGKGSTFSFSLPVHTDMSTVQDAGVSLINV